MATQADYALMLQKQADLNLKYRTKIIENELNHEKLRAKQYEDKYKDAMFQSQYSQGQNLIQKLNQKQNELFDCQNQLIQLNRKLTNTTNLPTQNDLIALAQQNEQLMQNIEQIKAAAISAIIMKQQQIEELKRQAQKYYLMQNELKFQYEKYESLQRQFELALVQKDGQITQLNEKIGRQRQVFLTKLQNIQKQASQQQNFKQKLLEKTYDLQGNLQKSQNIINEYENKIYQLQHQINQQKLINQQQKTKLKFEIQDLQQSIKSFQKQQKNLYKYIQDYKIKQKNMQDNINKLNQINDDLKHKLSIKKKKQNNKIKDKITASFSGLDKHNTVYTSFAFRNNSSIFQQLDQNLGEIPQIDDLGEFIQNFSTQQIESPQTISKQPLPLSKVMSKNKQKPVLIKQKSTEAHNEKTQLKNEKLEELLKQIQNQKLTAIRLQTQKKQLQNNLNGVYNQMQQLNKSLNNVTIQLQKQRKNISQLRQQLKKTKKQAQLIVDMQSLTLHVEKLQNDMIATKLKYAEQIDHQKEKHQRQKIAWTEKLVKLTDKIAKQDLQIPQKEVKTEQKKKKKGFFG